MVLNLDFAPLQSYVFSIERADGSQAQPSFQGDVEIIEDVTSDSAYVATRRHGRISAML